MISVTEAKEIILQNCSVPESVCVNLENANGKILAEDIYSKVDMPAFPQSSVDGYAFNFQDWQKNKKLSISGEIPAGNADYLKLLPGEAIRIFTGAPVPPGADTVVMQEKTNAKDKVLSINDDAIFSGANVRAKAAEINNGDLALEKGRRLTPAAIGFLACVGISKVFVYRSPSVSIIVTGDELQKPGDQLAYGQVYESNSFALRSALASSGVEDINFFQAKDDLPVLTGILKNALEKSDIVLLTGGVSVGDYDFVLEAAENCGVQKIFHKVRQKPGKPLYFGKKESKIVFGLPGNPASVLTCFYQYVVLVLQCMNKEGKGLPHLQLPLKIVINKVPGLTHFLKGYFAGASVLPLTGQESFRMSSFAGANCLIEVGEDISQLNKNDLVKVYLLPE